MTTEQKLAALKGRLALKRCDTIQKLLSDAGVPETVSLSKDPVVPYSDPVSRLKWFLLRRKDVQDYEKDIPFLELTPADLEWIRLNAPFNR